MSHRNPVEARPILYDHKNQLINPKDAPNEDMFPYLPDLYRKKFRLIEKVESLRKEYFIDTRTLAQREQGMKFERKKCQWDIVLEEAKWVAIDIMEERKSKIAIAQYISKKVKKHSRQKQVSQNEIDMFHRLVSTELSSMVTKAFESVYRTKEFSEKKETATDADGEIKMEDMELEFGDNDTSDVRSNGTNDPNAMQEEKPRKLKGQNKLKKLNVNRNSGFEDEILDVEKIRIDGFNHLQTIQQIFKSPVCLKPDAKILDYIYRVTSKLVEQEIDDKTENFSDLSVSLHQKDFKINKGSCIREIQKCFKKYKNRVSGDLSDILSRMLKETDHEYGLDPTKGLRTIREISMNNSREFPSVAPNLNREVSTLSTGVNSKEDKKRKKHISIPAPNPKDVPTKQVHEQYFENYTFNIRDARKLKEKENTDELLTLFYEEPLAENDYENMFKISIENYKNFPRKADTLTLEGFFPGSVANETYQEPLFDDKLDSILSQNQCDLESFSSYLRDKLIYLRPDSENIVKRNPQEERLMVQDFIRYLPITPDETYFLYQKEGIRCISSKFDIKQSIDSIQWLPIVNYLVELYVQKYGNRWNLITDFLNMNILSKGSIHLTERAIEFKWLNGQTDKRKKLFNLERKRLPITNKYVETPPLNNKAEQDEKKDSEHRVRFRRLQKNYTNFIHERGSTLKTDCMPSHALFSRIREHVKHEGENILGLSTQQHSSRADMEVVNLTRIIFPESMDREIYQRYKGSDAPPSNSKKGRVANPHLAKVLEDIISVTGTHPIPQQPPVVQGQRPPQPNLIPGQPMMANNIPSQPIINPLNRIPSGGSQGQPMLNQPMRPNIMPSNTSQPLIDPTTGVPHPHDHGHVHPSHHPTHPSNIPTQPPQMSRNPPMMNNQQPMRQFPPNNAVPTQQQRMMMQNQHLHNPQMMGGVPNSMSAIPPQARMPPNDPRLAYPMQNMSMPPNVMGGMKKK